MEEILDNEMTLKGKSADEILDEINFRIINNLTEEAVEKEDYKEAEEIKKALTNLTIKNTNGNI